MNRALGFFYVLLAGIGFGFLGIFGRLALQSGMSVGELLTWRFSAAAILLWLGLAIFKPRLLRLPPKQILISCALGAGGYAVFSTLYFMSIEGISVPLAALLLFTFPLFVSLGSHFILKERMSSTQSFSLLLATIGLGILLWGPLFVHSKMAVLYGLGAALTYSIYVLVSGKVQTQVPPLSSSLYVITAAAIALYFYHHPSIENLRSFNTLQLTCILGLATISTIGPLTLFLAGLQRLPSAQASIIVMIEPVIAAFAAGLILGEHLQNTQLFGAVLVLAALAINALAKARS
jgi:drug/metabolite transporter (DMT)-like permease